MPAKRFGTLSILLTVLCLILSLPAHARADKEEGRDKEKVYTNKDAEKAEVTDKTDQVYTNEDLERLFGSDEPATEPAEESGEAAAEQRPAPAEDEDPLTRMKRQQAERQDREQAIKDAEKKVAELRERITKLESGALTARNTLLTRRVAPKKPDPDSEMAEGWDELDQKERVERVDQELEKTREELKQAEEALAKLRSGG